jgi:hypothetical protein
VDRTRQAYLEAAVAAADLIADPAVVAAWERPSALPKMTVGGLAAHLGQQVLNVPSALAHQVPAGEAPISLLEHYARVAWLGADIDNEANTGIRAGSEDQATAGADALLSRVRGQIDDLRERLAGEPPGRVVRLPWTAGWSLSLEDLLVTRMMEIAVHSDDLAVSVGLEPPGLPVAVMDPVLELLTRLSARRHGATAVLRALSRAERAPGSVSAF